MAIRFLKAAFNADTDGLAGIQQLAGDATLLYYMTEEGKRARTPSSRSASPTSPSSPACRSLKGAVTMSARYAIGYRWTRYRIPFKRPLVTAHGTFPYREGAIVEVTDGMATRASARSRRHRASASRSTRPYRRFLS